MKNISNVDKNFKLEEVKKDNIVFFDPEEDSNFRIHGVFKENGRFRRLPENLAKSVSEGLYSLHSNNAGGRVRFKTNSGCVVIKAMYAFVNSAQHFALTGTAALDIYAKGDNRQMFMGTFIPPMELPQKNEYDSIVHFPSSEMREITINFPLYSDISKLYIGVEENSVVLPPSDYSIKKPVVYYGSSITQGGCASRPGGSYQSILSSLLDCDYINLGFSGNAKGETAVAQYIASIDMSAFVMDYDHNAPSVEHLASTHENFFRIIRDAHKELPILIMSRPKYYLDDTEKERLNICRQTYENALSHGDKNVYFIPGNQLMDDWVRDNGTVDDAHPTDAGFASMARVMYPVMKKMLKS